MEGLGPDAEGKHPTVALRLQRSCRLLLSATTHTFRFGRSVLSFTAASMGSMRTGALPRSSCPLPSSLCLAPELSHRTKAV